MHLQPATGIYSSALNKFFSFLSVQMPKAANCIQMSESPEGSAAAEEAIPHPLVTMSPVSTECCRGGLVLFLLSLCHHSSCSQALLALQSVKCSCLVSPFPGCPGAQPQQAWGMAAIMWCNERFRPNQKPCKQKSAAAFIFWTNLSSPFPSW